MKTLIDVTGRYLTEPPDNTKVWKLIETGSQCIHFNVIPHIDDQALWSGLLYNTEAACIHAWESRQASQLARRSIAEAKSRQLMGNVGWQIIADAAVSQCEVVSHAEVSRMEGCFVCSFLCWPTRESADSYLTEVGSFQVWHLIMENWI